MSKSRRKSPQRLTGEWPAPTTTSEKIQIFALLGLLAVAAAIAFIPSSQLLTPISLIWRLALTAIGSGIGLQVSRLLSRVNRHYNSRSTNFVAGILVTFTAGFLFYAMAWSIAESREFRGGGTVFTGTYRVVNCTVDKHGYDHWLTINSYGLLRAAMVPIGKAQYDRIRATIADCRSANLCVQVPSERAPDGAIRILVGEESSPPDFLPVRTCGDVVVQASH
jgi:hypothetical protein